MVSHAGKQYFLLLQLATILLLYHNCRKSRETHCGQCNQKVATQTDIQCVFHLLHEPVKEDLCKDIAEEIYFAKGFALRFYGCRLN
jgi:hypothetical protein